VETKKQKIAILGGGAGAMAAAFELTSVPGWQEHYEITVYQQGWRLGGKGASGRNAELGQRIEEHGLHLWFGWYENAFRVMRLVYDEQHAKNLAPESPFQSWRDAFTGFSECAWMDQFEDQWQSAGVKFPNMSGEPGSDERFDAREALPTPWDCMFMGIELMMQYYNRPEEQPAALKLARRALPGWLAPVVLWVSRKMQEWHFTPLHVLERILKAIQRRHPEEGGILVWILSWLVRLVLGWVIRWADPTYEKRPLARQALRAIQVGAATMRGAIRDHLLDRGLRVLEDRDLIEWLESNGASSARQVFLPLYDGGFAYAEGDPNRLSMAADAALLFSIRSFFTYRGYFGYHMNAGMGDTIFAPLYLVLRHRGVRFEYFHQVRNLGLSADGRNIEKVEVDVQVKPKHGTYDPLVTVRGLPCWPSAPHYGQLERGEELRAAVARGYSLESYTEANRALWKPVAHRTLRHGEDFDRIVLGISLGALPHLCKELIAAKPEWAAMAANVKTVRTQAAQLWLKRTPHSIGGRYPVLGCYLEPYDTIANMSHLIAREDWRPEDGVEGIIYLCNTLRDGEDIEQVRRKTLDFLSSAVTPVWPKGCGPGTPGCLDWSLLVDRADAAGPARLDSQYIRANVEGSELYVISVPGSGRYRLKSDGSGCDNLVLAGDWTDNGLNMGCVEAAVISGALASRAICGSPEFVYGAFGLPVRKTQQARGKARSASA